VFVEDFAAKLPTAPQFTVCAPHLKNLRHREGFDKLSPNGGCSTRTRGSPAHTLPA
jgi:hypothetical protein